MTNSTKTTASVSEELGKVITGEAQPEQATTTDTDQPTTVEGEGSENTTTEGGEPETWIDGKPFDADVAKRLVANLREDKRQLKEELAALRAERENTTTADTSPENIDPELEAELKTLRAEVAALRTQDLKKSVLSEVGLPLEYADMVNGDTREQIEENVQRLLALRDKPTSTQVVEPAQVATNNTGTDRNAMYARAFGL